MPPNAIRTILTAVPTLALAAIGVAHAAQPATVAVDGELEVRVEDYKDGHSRTRHFLKTPKGKFELRFDRRPTKLMSGAKVRVHGRPEGQVMLLTDGAQVQVTQTQSLAALPSTLGEQKIAVLLVNFSDDTSQPISTAAANTLLFDTLDDWYQQNSFGQTWLSGQVFGYYTIAQSKTTCDPDTLAAQADAAAAQRGVDLSGFKRKVYLFPSTTCQWSGQGNLGGSTTRAWANGAFQPLVVGHELGHNLGLRHAHAKDCDVSALGDTCTSRQYGDAADMMGNNQPGHFNAFEKQRLGWLDDGVSPPIHAATKSGRYSIEPYASQSVGTKAIRVPRGVDSYGQPSYYYIEYRQPIGADSVLATGNMTKGVMVRLGSDGDPESSYQLDMTPNSSTNSVTEMADGALAVGATYSDAAAGVSFTLVSADANGATVDVVVGGATPPPPPPPPAGVLTESIGTDKTLYVRGETVYASALVKRDGVVASGVSVVFTVTLPGGATATMSATSGSDGYARATYRTAKGKGAVGAYGLRGVATSNGASANATASFNVK
jgi:M6 family metalloprotease-like protein